MRVALTARAFDLLAVLAAQPGRLFSAEALISAVWPRRVVDPNNLRVQILHLRRHLGPDVVVNVPGRGYMLGLPVAVPVSPRRQGQVPTWTEPMLGRRAEMERLDALLVPGRPLTMVGPPGVGKTRLAAEAARRRLGRHADGVWWVDLVRTCRAQEVPAAIAQALQLQVGELQGADAGSRVGLALAARNLMLVLDNAEHLATDLKGLVRDLLRTAHMLVLLVTSRQPLHCAGEHVLRVEPFPLPPLGGEAAHERANVAVQMLERHARKADAAFFLRDGELPAAAHLCRKLEGLPLAIELAGAALPKAGVASALEGIADGAAASAPADSRHRSIETALAWSHAQLSAAEQRCLRRLAVFNSAFRLHEAQQVGALDDLAPDEALRCVQALAQHSLLQVQATEALPRFRLLESTRTFALRRLADAGETAAAKQQHMRAMSRLARQASRAFWLLPDATWLEQWRADGADWLQACDRACAEGDAESAAPLSDALAQLAAMTGHFGELRQRVPALVSLGQHQVPGRTRAALLDRLAVGPAPGIPRAEGARLRVEAWRAEGQDRPALARALSDLAVAAEMTGDRHGCDAALAEAEALVEPHWTARERAYGTARVRPSIAARRHDLPRLRRACLVMHDAFAACGSSRLAVLARCDLGTHALYDARPLDAVGHVEAAIVELRELGHDVDAAIALGILAVAWLDQGDVALAKRAVRQSVALLAPDPDALRFGLEAMAWLAAVEQRGAEAARLLGASDSLRQRTGLARNPLNERTAQAATQASLSLQGPLAHERHRAEGRLLDATGALKLAQHLWPPVQDEEATGVDAKPRRR